MCVYLCVNMSDIVYDKKKNVSDDSLCTTYVSYFLCARDEIMSFSLPALKAILLDTILCLVGTVLFFNFINIIFKHPIIFIIVT